MNASLQVLALLTTVLVCPSLSSQRAGPSARITLPDRGGVFAAFGIDRSETRSLAGTSAKPSRRLSRCNSAFQFALARTMAGESSLRVGHRARMIWGPFIQKWIDASARGKMPFRNDSRIRSGLRRVEIDGMLSCTHITVGRH
jgi:hypothetical protein